MAKIKDVIERVDSLKPNAFSEEQKVSWLAQLEGKLAAEVFLINAAGIRNFQYQYPDDMDTELLVSFPYDDLYDHWLEAQIDYANGEYDRYQNSTAMYNASYESFATWFLSLYDPAQGYRRDDYV